MQAKMGPYRVVEMRRAQQGNRLPARGNFILGVQRQLELFSNPDKEGQRWWKEIAEGHAVSIRYGMRSIFGRDKVVVVPNLASVKRVLVDTEKMAEDGELDREITYATRKMKIWGRP